MAELLTPLSDLSLQQFSKLVDSLLNEMTGSIPDPWQNLTSDLEWSDQMSHCIRGQLIKIVIEIMHCKDSQKVELLKKVFDGEKSEYLASCVTSKKLHIVRALLRQHNGSVKNTLNDFEWRVKWILGNSASTIMKYPIIGLDLNTFYMEKSESESIALELTRHELNSFIEILEEQYNKFKI